ncbi:MAG: hypothetical protein HY739_07575 [Desulfobacterales bacterium]|nr:hypothetical protein [Desulfobacterales bacterium]
MKSLEKKELKELLHRSWIIHDGMWFHHCLEECGIEKTNKLNKAAMRSMAMIEIKRMKKALGIEKTETFKEFKGFLEGVYEIVNADFINLVYIFPSENFMHLEMPKCFAYEGMKMMGMIDQYQCAVYHRIEAWFDSLEIRYSVTPQVESCMMLTDGNCFRDYKFYF